MKKLILLLLLMVSTNVMAKSIVSDKSSYDCVITGNDLAKHILEYNKFENGSEYNLSEVNAFMSYVLGVFDTSNNIFWCIYSSNINTAQVAKIVIKYINNNPEKLHLCAATLVINALSEAFPCKK